MENIFIVLLFSQVYGVLIRIVYNSFTGMSYFEY